MNIIDVVFFGWYRILYKTLYSMVFERGAFGPVQHSFFISFFCHGLNVNTIITFVMFKYFHSDLPAYFQFILAGVIFLIGYIIYFRRNRRVDMVISREISTAKALFFVLISLGYAVLSAIFMLKLGDYIRYQLIGA